MRFVSEAARPADEPYEAYIARTGCVPTRDNLHDAFNRLVWCHHPSLKRRMNALHVHALDQAAVTAAHDPAQGHGARKGRRGPLRDALTHFDEFGAWWPNAPEGLQRALRARDWHALFVAQREAWRDHRLVIVGHALLEQLAVAPRKGLTAHVLLTDEPLALSASDWAARPLLPLPVMGIPGWSADNASPAFYDDPRVFRTPSIELPAAIPT